jgi:hypothetical protein
LQQKWRRRPTRGEINRHSPNHHDKNAIERLPHDALLAKRRNSSFSGSCGYESVMEIGTSACRTLGRQLVGASWVESALARASDPGATLKMR